MSLRGDLGSLKRFATSMRKLSTVLAQKVAAAAAPALTDAGLATFEAGEDAYGVTWAPGVDGQRVTLQKSGALARGIRYVAIGTRIRVALSVPYAKYQIGKRPVFPRPGEPLPKAFSAALAEATGDAMREELAT